MSKDETIDPGDLLPLLAWMAPPEPALRNPPAPAGVKALVNTVRAIVTGAAKDDAPSSPAPERVVTPPPSRLRIPCARCGKYAWSAQRNPAVKRYEADLRIFRANHDRPRPPRPICPECRAKEKGKK